MALVSGYDSDSGSDAEAGPSRVPGPSRQTGEAGAQEASSGGHSNVAVAGRASRGLSSLLPPPKLNSASNPVSAKGLAQGVSKAEAPKKRQINIGTLSSLRAADGDSDSGPADVGGSAGAKRARLGSAAVSPPLEARRTHSLLGMLPAVKGPSVVQPRGTEATGDPGLKIASNSRQSPPANGLTSTAPSVFEATDEVGSGSPHEEDRDGVSSTSKVQQSRAATAKGNDAFRAMLGLAPSSTAPPRPPQVESSPPESRVASAHANMPTSDQSLQARRAQVSQPESGMEHAQGEGGFFGLGECPFVRVISTVRSASHLANSSWLSSTGLSAPDDTPQTHGRVSSVIGRSALAGTARSKFSVEAAPTLQSEEADAYPGWSQDPDGTWVPITPAAHAQYASWIASQSSDVGAGAGSRNASKGTAEANAELARAGLRADQLYTIDAGRKASEAYEAPSNAANRQAPAAAARSDARYAAVAAAMKQAQASGGGAQENEEEEEDMDGKSRKDKKDRAGFRARQKGQLSALFAHADEERERLEEKWANHRSNKRKANERYGF